MNKKNKYIIFISIVFFIITVILTLNNFTIYSAHAQSNSFCDSVAQISTSQCEALVELYDNTAGINWINNSGWLNTNTPCSWYGITCDATLSKVDTLELNANNLAGPIPNDLENLVFLQRLELADNHLIGEIPVELGSFENLYLLDLSGNLFTGNIPSELGNLSSLKYLFLQNNQLTGNIPTELINPPLLTGLVLSGNQLTGTIPSELGQLNNLENLWLDNNQYFGEIPPELGDLTSLTLLDLSNNNLTGLIPSELGHLTNIGRMLINNNQISGGIPVSFGGLTKLIHLSISNNQLSGSLPSELGNLKDLETLRFAENNLSGNIPPEIGQLTKLKIINFYSNQLSDEIPPEFGNLIDLEILRLSENELTGSIPPELGNLNNLQILAIGKNHLDGVIPPELGNLTMLNELRLFDNQLSGPMPPELGNLINLKDLNLTGNHLTGAIPSELGNLNLLESLSLSGNQLTGSIPEELGNLIDLKSLLLQNNALEGEVPFTITNLHKLEADTTQTNFRFNRLSASDPIVSTFLTDLDQYWDYTQTVPPTDLQIINVSSTSIEIAWTPILYTWNGGYYSILISNSPGGPYTSHGDTADKNASGYLVGELDPNTTYFFVVRTFTPSHDYQQNDLWSAYSEEISAQTLPAQNTPPEITVNSSEVIVDEAQIAHNVGTVVDVDGDKVTLSASVGSVVNNGDDTWSWEYLTNDGPIQSQLVTISADDGNGGISYVSFELLVNNVPPTIIEITAPIIPIDVALLVEVGATFIDPGLDVHTSVWDWGDDTTSVGVIVDGNITGAHQYTVPGVYTLSLAVSDDDGGSDTEIYEFIVIYNPEGGFVTGGGWFMSPEGACHFNTCTESTTGKANFGFVSKYKKGASIPTGNTEFQFKAGNLNFHSDVYDWLVVNKNDSRAQYKGTGTINGSGEYKFMLWAVDGTPDTFRIKIWYEEGGTEIVVYDNKVDGVAEFGQSISGGNILVHK